MLHELNSRQRPSPPITTCTVPTRTQHVAQETGSSIALTNARASLWLTNPVAAIPLLSRPVNFLIGGCAVRHQLNHSLTTSFQIGQLDDLVLTALESQPA